MIPWKITATAAVLLAMFMASAALAVDPDHVREATRPAPTPAQQADALSDAFKKFSTMHLLMWRVSGSGNLMIMGQFSSEKHCTEARKLLRGQIVRLGWGRAECLEIILP
jgi:hypothetical protein